MVSLRWLAVFAVCLLFLFSCSVADTAEDEEEEVKTESEEEVEEEDEEEENNDETEEKEEVEEEKKESLERDETKQLPGITEEELALLEVYSIEDMRIEMIELDNLYDEDNNFPAHTEKEIVIEFSDEEGFINFDLDDQPIRNITSEDGKINNITNYSDHFIDMLEEVAFVYPEENLEVLYKFVVTQGPEIVEGYDGDDDIDFRPFDELTNLERAMLSAVGFTAPLLNGIEEMIMTESFDEEAYEVIIDQFDIIGAPSVLIPAPQSLYDYELFNIMLMIKESWLSFSQFEDPEEDYDAFIESYLQLRQVTNNIFAYLFITIGEIE